MVWDCNELINRIGREGVCLTFIVVVLLNLNGSTWIISEREHHRRGTCERQEIMRLRRGSYHGRKIRRLSLQVLTLILTTATARMVVIQGGSIRNRSVLAFASTAKNMVRDHVTVTFLGFINKWRVCCCSNCHKFRIIKMLCRWRQKRIAICNITSRIKKGLHMSHFVTRMIIIIIILVFSIFLMFSALISYGYCIFGCF